MQKGSCWAMALTGGLAGAVNGLFGAGGGMILVPLLTRCASFTDEAVFPASISIILPICIVSLFFTSALPVVQAIPWLIGSALGGFLAGKWGQRIPVLWLHRGLGILILWGGVRYLW